MHERTTNHNQSKGKQKIYTLEKVADTYGMGPNRKRDGGCRKISDSSSYALSMEEGAGARGANILKRQTA